MIAACLFDILASEDQFPRADSQKITAELAGQFVASALADWQRIRDCEEYIGTCGMSEPSQRLAINRSMYRAYQEWSDGANHLLPQVRRLVKSGVAMPDLEPLEDAYARIQCRLQLTPEMTERAIEQVNRGEGIPLKELRDELSARVRT